MPAPIPLNIGPPPIRTKFDSQKDDPQGSGIAWPWLKFIQSIWTAITTLNFQNISGKINISQINASGTPSATTVLYGDARWDVIPAATDIDGGTF